MSRSAWKGLFIQTNMKSFIMFRGSTISSRHLNKTVAISNGRTEIAKTIKRKDLGFKYGSFSYPRKKQNKMEKPIKKKK